jgi:TolB-like protein
MSALNLLQRLQKRKLVQWGVAYVAAVFALLQGVDIIAAKFGWSDTVGRILIIASFVGFFVTLLLAWYHGERGVQKVSGTELLLLSLLLAIGGGLLWKFAPSEEATTSASTSASVPANGPASESGQLAPTSGKSVAVLPFENRSAGGEDAAFLADGIQEDLINTLSRVPGLTVLARTAVLPFRDSSLAVAQIAAQLGVTHLVEAGVQRAGDRVRINVQLLRASDGQTDWSERYDRTLSATNIFDLQEEITEAVASTLKLQLDSAAGGGRLAGTTDNLAAYELFLKGRKEWSDGSTVESVRLFKEALKLDPNYALAHGALAEAYVFLAMESVLHADEAFSLAEASARRAIELDDRVVQAYTALGEIAFHYDWNWPEAEKSMLRAIAIDPNYAIAYARHSGHLRSWGRFDEAMVFEQRSDELFARRSNDSRVHYLSDQRRYKEMLELLDSESLPDDKGSPDERAIALLNTGHPGEAVQLFERLSAEHPESLSRRSILGWAYGRAGQPAKARKILQELQATANSRYLSPQQIAQVAIGLGELDLAFAKLNEAYELRDPRMPFLGEDWVYDSVRGDPRYRELLRKMKLDQFFPEPASK